jgi:hypothetical protein
MTRPSSEPYCRKRRLPPSSCSGKPTSTSPPTNELKTSLGERSPRRQHRDMTRTSNPTNAGRRDRAKKCTPPDHLPLAPREDVAGRAHAGRHPRCQCPYHKDMRHTPRNCRDFKHSVGHGRPFQPLPPPPPRGGPEEPRQPQQQEEGGGGAFPCIDREVNVIFGGHGSQENRRHQKLNNRQILVATTGPPALYRWSEHPITFTRADQWLNFDHPGKYPLLVDPVI